MLKYWHLYNCQLTRFMVNLVLTHIGRNWERTGIVHVEIWIWQRVSTRQDKWYHVSPSGIGTLLEQKWLVNAINVHLYCCLCHSIYLCSIFYKLLCIAILRLLVMFFRFVLKYRDAQEATDTFADPNLLQNLQSNHVSHHHYLLMGNLSHDARFCCRFILSYVQNCVTCLRFFIFPSLKWLII